MKQEQSPGLRLRHGEKRYPSIGQGVGHTIVFKLVSICVVYFKVENCRSCPVLKRIPVDNLLCVITHLHM